MTTTTERELVLDIHGMTCASCVGKVERALGKVPGVEAAAVNLATRTATVRTSASDLGPLLAAVRGAGYTAGPHDDDRPTDDDARDLRRRLWVSAPLTLAILLLTFVVPASDRTMWAVAVMATVVQGYGGWPFMARAIRAARHGSATMDTLVSIGSLAAYAYSMWAVLDASFGPTPAHGHGAEAEAVAHYFDTGAVIITLILIGRLLETKARLAAADASRVLLARAATEARVLDRDGAEHLVPIDELRPGARVVVLPGEKVPADGVVKLGTSWIDLSLLTGESVPVDVGPGDEVIGASINGHGRLEVFVTKVGGQATLAEIVRLLQHAQGSKAHIQRLADRISGVFVPVVLVLAAATFAGWLLWTDVSAGQALLHATAVVLIACPCALGLATPTAIMAGAGRAAELGILIRGGEVIERARATDLVVLDKTGTITEGRMQLAEVAPSAGWSEEGVLSLAAAVERGSEHPIAVAIVGAAAAAGVDVPHASDHRVEPGAGASAVVAGTPVQVGRLEEASGEVASTAASWAGRGWTAVEVTHDGALVGLIAVADRVRAEAPAALARLRTMGVRTRMLTGDRQATAEAVALTVGVDDVVAEVYPAGKVDEISHLRSEGNVVAFVGDGLNDAPALATADVGIAMGSGTDVALAAADIQLLGGSLDGVPDAIAICRRTYRIISENLFWAFAYNVVMIPLAMFGILDPTLAAASMALSSVTVVLNALRLRRFGKDRAAAGVAHREVALAA